jgi:energy-coupling factor transport system permease protein
MVGVGVVAAFLGLAGAGGRVGRSRYRPDPWLLPEWLVLGSGVAAATLAVVASHEEVLAAYPSLTAWPALSLTHLVAVGLAVVGGLASPAPAEPAVVAA